MFKRKKRNHPNVGRLFYSPFFKRNIRVVAFNKDDKWWFCFDGTQGTELYREHKAESKLSYFENNRLEVE